MQKKKKADAGQQMSDDEKKKNITTTDREKLSKLASMLKKEETNDKDKDEQKALTGVILNLMKKTYLTFNQDSVEDNQILTDLKIISKDQLEAPEEFQMISTNEVLAMTKKKPTHSNKNQKHQKTTRKRRRP